MKMKIIYFAALIIGLSACNKQLDTAPSDAVSEDIVLKNVDNLTTISEGTWATMMDDFYGGTYSNPGFKTIALTSDAMANDVALITTKYGFPTAYRFTQMNDKTQSRVSAIWGQLYKIINNSNIIIANAEKVEGDSTAKKVLKGQALALRAHTYLTIASFYQYSYLKDSLAKTAPIYTTPTTASTAGNPKATLKDIYELIFADLISARDLLANYDRPAKYKINADVVNGLLARAYLNTGRWALAAAAAEEAQENYPLMAASEYSKGFNDAGNSEWIWGHSEIPSQSDGSYSFHFLDVSSSSSYYYSFMADPLFGELFEDGDIRKTLFSWDGSAAAREGYLQYKKFRFKADQTADLVLMRSAEAVLIEAEGYARAGNLSLGIDALNKLRTARGAHTFESAGATQETLIKEILTERRKELWGEGFGLSDIIRNQLSVVRKPYVDANGNDIKVTVATPSGTKQVPAKYHTALTFSDGSPFTANSPYYLFVIPQGEEQNNPNLNN
jgi:starch-binding outer membrane protein, SusD/RagB family